MEANYSSVLLRWKAEFRRSGESTFQDFSAAFFMLEELIAAGASKVVTDNDIFTTRQALLSVPELIRKRFELVDPGESRQMALTLVKPVLDELGLEATGHVGLGHIGGGDGRSIREACTLYFALPDFLLACREQLQLDFPLMQVRDAITKLRAEIRDPAGRAVLATLAGVFSSYRPIAVDSLVVQSNMPQRSATQFMELLEDELFRQMSATGWLMGIPSKVDYAIAKFGRRARRIAESPLFKPIVNLASKSISTAAHFPVPDSEIGCLIIKEGFMPPIIPSADLQEYASQKYLSSNTPVLIHPSLV